MMDKHRQAEYSINTLRRQPAKFMSTPYKITTVTTSTPRNVILSHNIITPSATSTVPSVVNKFNSRSSSNENKMLTKSQPSLNSRTTNNTLMGKRNEVHFFTVSFFVVII